MVNGTLMWYSQICHRQVWLMAHSIAPDQRNKFIEVGREIHQIFYSSLKKELLIDNLIKIDILDGKVVAEVKKSDNVIKSAIMQTAFYLYYLKKSKGIYMKGKVLVPQKKKSYEVILDSKMESEVEENIMLVESIVSNSKPPKPVWIKYCKQCAYKELCWS